MTAFHHVNAILACAACYGQSDSSMAQGMNWGIAALLAVTMPVLATIAAFFIYLSKRAASAKAANSATGLWGAATCRRFGIARHVAQSQSACMAARSKTLSALDT